MSFMYATKRISFTSHVCLLLFLVKMHGEMWHRHNLKCFFNCNTFRTVYCSKRCWQNSCKRATFKSQDNTRTTRRTQKIASFEIAALFNRLYATRKSNWKGINFFLLDSFWRCLKYSNLERWPEGKRFENTALFFAAM